MGGRAGIDLSAAAAVLGHAFKDQSLLAEALTHPSAATDPADPRRDYQRLEFLGDRVLGLVVAERLFAQYPDEDEGHLARRFAVLVSRPTLAEVSAALGLARFMQVGRGGPPGGIDQDDRALADCCEAVIGALYLDGGLEVAAAFIDREWQPFIAGQKEPPRDPKTALQEWTQARGLGLPSYAVVGSTGPAHAPLFQITVSVHGVGTAEASGSTKREAERAAAERLLRTLDSHDARPKST